MIVSARGQVRRACLMSLVLGALVLLALPAAADEVDGGGGGYGDLTFAGTGGSWTGTMTLRGGFPATTYTSTSRAGNVGVQGGTSSFLNLATPPGAVFGSSQGRPYLNLRPRVDNPPSASVTTYVFSEPTPDAGWAFVLGDIDSDSVTVSALGADGEPVPTSDLGFAGAFSYCGGSPSPCTRTTPPDEPVWDASSATLTGNATATDTNGASGWFEPSVPLTRLTLTFTRRAGFPVYQTWFANRVHDVSGTITGCQVANLPVSLVDTTGRVVATTTTAEDGTYAFRDFTASDYTVALDVPQACETEHAEQPVDLAPGDVTADFALVPRAAAATVPPTPAPASDATTTDSVPDAGSLPNTGG